MCGMLLGNGTFAASDLSIQQNTYLMSILYQKFVTIVNWGIPQEEK